MIFLTNTILYNHVIVFGTYDRFFNYNLLQEIISLDILTTRESCT